MKKKNKKIVKWILIGLGIALAFYLVGDGQLFSVVSESTSSISGGGGGLG